MFQRHSDVDRSSKPVKSPSNTSFALTYVQQHGAPFAIVIDKMGNVRARDQRPQLAELLASFGPTSPGRLPELLLRVVRRTFVTLNRAPEPAMSLIEPDIVVGVTALEGDGEAFACWLWRVDPNRVLQRAKHRYGLTTRELELLDRILTGAASADIAQTLCISNTTVEWHTKRLLLKTESQNRTQMTARILGWIPDRI